MDDRELLEKKLDSKEYFNGRVVSLRVDDVLLPDGTTSFREVVHNQHGGAAVLPLLENGDVLLVRQCRYPYEAVLTEIPAGKLDQGETPLDCAKRELKEETGGVAENYRFLGEIYPTPAYLDEVLRIFAATGITLRERHLDPGEFAETIRMPLAELVDRVLKGEIRDAKTHIAALKVWILQEKGEI